MQFSIDLISDLNLNKESFDCVFIDGLHTYNQVKKDIHNSLKYLNINGIIMLHDCLPNNFSICSIIFLAVII